MRSIGIAVWVSLVIALAGLPAGVQAERTADTSRSEEKASSTPGFAAVVVVAGVLAVYLRRRRR